jgi:hypothetical protein
LEWPPRAVVIEVLLAGLLSADVSGVLGETTGKIPIKNARVIVNTGRINYSSFNNRSLQTNDLSHK